MMIFFSQACGGTNRNGSACFPLSCTPLGLLPLFCFLSLTYSILFYFIYVFIHSFVRLLIYLSCTTKHAPLHVPPHHSAPHLITPFDSSARPGVPRKLNDSRDNLLIKEMSELQKALLVKHIFKQTKNSLFNSATNIQTKKISGYYQQQQTLYCSPCPD